jgi:hypothetical protein
MLIWKNKLIVHAYDVSVWNLDNNTETKLPYKISLYATVLFRDKLYIGTHEKGIHVISLETLTEVQHIALPHSVSALGLNSTRLLVYANNRVLVYDLTLMDLPFSWIQPLVAEPINSQEVLTWRSPTGHDFWMACAQYAPGSILGRLWEDLDVTMSALVLPNKYGECTVSVLYHTCRYCNMYPWEICSLPKADININFMCNNLF